MTKFISSRLILKCETDGSRIKELQEFVRNQDDTDFEMDFRRITPIPAWVTCPIPEGELTEEGKEILNERVNWCETHWGNQYNALKLPYPPNSDLTDKIYFGTSESDVTRMIKNFLYCFQM